jgi:hypothetical protein
MAIQSFNPYVDPSVDPHVRTLLNLVFNKINNHAQAISQVNKTKTGASSTTIINESTSGGGGVAPSASIGTVDNQTGQVAYTTLPTDNGSLIILSDASPIAVTLNTGVTTPWIAFFANQGAGTATFTPSAGTISYAGNPGVASMPLLGGYCCIVAFDGTGFWAWTEPIVPVTKTLIAHEWLDSYDQATGIFTASRPAYSDLTGTPTLPATDAPTTGEYLTGYDATTGLFSKSTPAGVSGAISLAALTTGGTTGSITVTDGIITAFVNPT